MPIVALNSQSKTTRANSKYSERANDCAGACRDARFFRQWLLRKQAECCHAALLPRLARDVAQIVTSFHCVLIQQRGLAQCLGSCLETLFSFRLAASIFLFLQEGVNIISIAFSGYLSRGIYIFGEDPKQ
jgi:hypothetical protein